MSFLGDGSSVSDYDNVFKMAQDMYRELRAIKRVSDPESSLDRRYLQALSGKFSKTASEPPIAYREPAKGAVPIATQRRSIYFDPNSARMGLDSRAVVDEIAEFMRAYENTVVDIEGNTDSTGSRELNMSLSKQRADTVKNYLIEKFHFPPERMRTFGNGPDQPLDGNSTPEGREKNRRTDIKVYPNAAKS
jgi:outer membrane protein OmpA-like peptidoglycan-associated protein